jgi:hypothetical protein
VAGPYGNPVAMLYAHFRVLGAAFTLRVAGRAALAASSTSAVTFDDG